MVSVAAAAAATAAVAAADCISWRPPTVIDFRHERTTMRSDRRTADDAWRSSRGSCHPHRDTAAEAEGLTSTRRPSCEGNRRCLTYAARCVWKTEKTFAGRRNSCVFAAGRQNEKNRDGLQLGRSMAERSVNLRSRVQQSRHHVSRGEVELNGRSIICIHTTCAHARERREIRFFFFFF
jgi:hypothetical protein